MPDGWPYLAWGASLLLSLVLSVVAPVLLLPLFLRSEPLAPGALRTMAEELVARSGLHVSDIRLLLMSEKTTSANAAVVGLGPTRRILLGDTLTGDEADDGRLAESRAVLAHEPAHHAHGDMWRGLALEAGSALLAWTLAAALLAQLPTAPRTAAPATRPRCRRSRCRSASSRSRSASSPRGTRAGASGRPICTPTGWPTASRSPGPWSGWWRRTWASWSRRG